MQQDQKCVRCLGCHNSRGCRFRDAVCHDCKRNGRIARACKGQKRFAEKHDSHRLASASEGEQSKPSTNLYQLSNVKAKQIREPIPKFTVTLKVEGKLLNFEVDSGAACSIISEQTYRETWARNSPALPQDVPRLRTCTGEGLRAVGSTQVRVRFMSKDCILPLVVMEGSGRNLLGRDWFKALHVRVSGIHHVREAVVLDTLSKIYDEVFAENIDEHRGAAVSLELKEDATLCFLKARPVPFVLKNAVEEETDKLVSQRVLEPTQHSHWATPVVIVKNRDGSIRLCGDYRGTVNLEAKAASCPLPTTAALFADL